MMQIYHVIFEQPIINLLVAFTKIFEGIHLPGAFGWAIIALTVLIRFLLQPFFHKQMEASHKMTALKPQLDNLAKKHGKDKARLQKEQLKLYQEAGINPAQGCLLMIFQIPIFIALYNTLRLFLFNGGFQKALIKINAAVYHPVLQLNSINPSFFIFNLAETPAKAGVWYYLLIPVITGFLQYVQASMMSPEVKKEEKLMDQIEKAEKGEKKEKVAASDDFQKAMNTQMKYLFPVLIGWFAYSLPVGLSLYWNIFSLFGIWQQHNIKKQLAVAKS